MKSLAIVLFACFTFACNAGTPAPKVEPAKQTQAETKKMCISVYDAKLKKDVEKCRTIKTHKKFEGTAVPEKKKK